jgi:thiol-disulfide isomerase/thioredoxin
MTFNNLTDYNKKYLKYKDKYLKLKKLEQNIIMKGGAPVNKTLTLFKAEWCGHCKSFKKTWNELKNENKNNINFVTYDSELNKNEISKYKIEGFPTLVLLTNDKAIEYVGPRNKEAIEEFIKQY